MTEPLTKAEMVSRYKAARRNLWSGRFAENGVRSDRTELSAPQRVRLLSLREKARLRRLEVQRLAKRRAAIEAAVAAKESSAIVARAIIEAVSIVSGISTADITGASRKYSIVYWRHIAMLVIKRRLPALSYCQIGRLFGRDHSTVMHSIENASDPSRAADIARVEAVLEGE